MHKTLFVFILASFVSLLSFTPAAAAAQKSTTTTKKVREFAGVVNVNTASVQEIAKLPGVGSSLALRIVERRAKEPFKKAEDLLSVKGVGKKNFQAFKKYVTVTGKTTFRLVSPANEAEKEQGKQKEKKGGAAERAQPVKNVSSGTQSLEKRTSRA